METATATDNKLRFRPCTHLTFRPAERGDKDNAGKAVPKGHLVIVRTANCHEEPQGVYDPAGVDAIPLTYISATEMRGALSGNRECLFVVKNERVYRASLGGDPPPQTEAVVVRPDYESMTAKQLLPLYNERSGKTLKTWSGKKADLVARLREYDA